MIEALCAKCGLKKTFQDDKDGKKYKCPGCGEVVEISKIVSQSRILDEETFGVSKNDVQKAYDAVPAALEKGILAKRYNLVFWLSLAIFILSIVPAVANDTGVFGVLCIILMIGGAISLVVFRVLRARLRKGMVETFKTYLSCSGALQHFGMEDKFSKEIAKMMEASAFEKASKEALARSIAEWVEKKD